MKRPATLGHEYASVESFRTCLLAFLDGGQAKGDQSLPEPSRHVTLGLQTNLQQGKERGPMKLTGVRLP